MKDTKKSKKKLKKTKKIKENEHKSAVQFPAGNPNPVYRVDSKGNILYSNKAGKILTNCKKCFKNKNIVSDNWLKIIKRSKRTKLPEMMEFECKSKHYLFHVNPVINTNYSIFYGHDITGQREVEEKYRALFEQAGDYLLVIDSETNRVLDVNEAAYKKHGYSSSKEMIGKSMFEVDARKWSKSEAIGMAKALQSGKTLVFETEHYKKDRSIFSIEVTARIVKVGNKSLIYSMERDISERKHQEETIMQKEIIVDSSSDMMALLDKRYRYLSVNKAYAKAFGKKQNEMLNMTVSAVFGKEFFTKVIKPHAVKCLGGETIKYYDWFSFADDKRRYMVITYFPVYNDNQEITGFVVNGRDLTEKRRVETVLQESEKRLSKAQDIARLGTWEWDIQKDAIIWSDGVYRLFGFKIGSAVDYSRYNKHIHPEDRKNVKKWVEEALEGKPYENTHRIIRDGEVRWHHTKGEVVRDNKGKPLKLFGVVQDITEKWKAEEALQKSEKKYRNMFETMTSGYALMKVIHEKGKIDCLYLSANPAHERLTGLKTGDIIGKTARECIPGLEDLWMDRYAQVEKTGKTVMIENYVAGLKRWYRVFAYRPEKGFVAVTFDDITEGKNAEKDTIKKNAYNKATAEIWKVASDKSVNKTELIQQLLNILGPAMGVSRACYNEIMGKDKFKNDTICTIEWCEQGVKPSVKTKIPSIIVRHYTKAGIHVLDREAALTMVPKALRPAVKAIALGFEKTFNIESVFAAPFYVNERLEGLLTFDVCKNKKEPVILDEDMRKIITEGINIISNHIIRMDFESKNNLLISQLVQSEKMAAVGTLTAGVAHEFNNLMAIIGGSAELGKMDDTLEKKDKYYKNILIATERASEIVQNLATFSKPGTAHKKRCNLNAIVKRVLILIKNQYEKFGIEIISKYSNIPDMYANEHEIQQAILNMFVNARDAMTKKGGRITIETDSLSKYVRIRITDTGCGIKKDKLSSIFEPFFTTKGALGGDSEVMGTGLGLSVSYGIIKRHNGTIEVESELNKGTIFTIKLPIKKK